MPLLPSCQAPHPSVRARTTQRQRPNLTLRLSAADHRLTARLRSICYDQAVIKRNPTRPVRAGSVTIGGGHPVAVQTMCATRTQDIDASVEQAERMRAAGAALVRLAVDSPKDVLALAEIRKQTQANLVVDLQENYRLATQVAPYVDKIRYNPGHLYHHEKDKPVGEKVAFLVGVAREHDCALRIGVNCGSVDPAVERRFPDDDVSAMVTSAFDHARLLDDLGFARYVVSMKDSHPNKVIEANTRFAAERPEVPLHLGVTEAGIPPDGILKTRIAFEQLLSRGIGDTLRVSLTLPNPRKHEEVTVGQQIIDDVAAGRFRSVPVFDDNRLNIISCPSCSRVENDRFVELAQAVQAMTTYAQNERLTIAVMGCRVNGPGETDQADLGLWCGPTHVTLKRGSESLGAFSYDEILPRLKQELDTIIATPR
jgi:(E)-4-hydroxy-3-methylbut-2-enyl-diphosphate synthase